MTRMAHPTARLVCGLAIICMLTAFVQPAAAQDPQKVLDHFLCYGVQPPAYSGPSSVALIDQFSAKPVTTKVVARQLLCNPVVKTLPNGTGGSTQLVHPRAHLLCYQAPSGSATRKVGVTNQFGSIELVVSNASMLCLPSSKIVGRVKPKTPAPIPTALDHFKCYAVKQINPVASHTVLLHDQFVRIQGTSYQAVELCNPTQKVIAGQQPTKVLYPYAHLVCYTIQLPEKDHFVFITNQFESDLGPLRVKMAQLLCLPSLKKLG
jgi:hypothetical protein